MEEVALSQQWSGLRCNAAPHIVKDSGSPATRDAALSDRKQALIGARKGRKIQTSSSFPINGIVPAAFPWGRYLLVSSWDGTVTATLVTWS